MVIMKRRLACCTWDKGVSIDFDQQDRIMTYNGLESCIINANSYDNESGTTGDGCASDSHDEDDSSSSSSNNACSSFSSHWTMMKRDEQGPDQWDCSDSPQKFYVKEKPSYTVQFSDVEAMKEKFAKLLLGDDITGGCKGLSTAVALSNAITNLAGTIFGELWKLEPLPNERKSKWRREMDWLLSPANYMVELVPAKQHGANGRMLEIMTPKVRSDIHMILPALQKLDSMLMETLDSMKSTEFWYAEGGSRAEGRSKEGSRQSKRWWFPLPQVPKTGLSDMERKKLLDQGKFVHQVFKAANSINENVLHEMEIPPSVREALPKSGKASLGDDLYKILNAESTSVSEILHSLNLKSERSALETINKLEAAALVWKARISDQAVGKFPVRTSWSFKKDPISELDKMEYLVTQAESLIKQLKIKYPNLPQTFLDVTKIQYGTDVGHSILEAYSRALANLAFRILSRIGDILQEDVLSNPNSPITPCFPGLNLAGVTDTTTPNLHVRQSLIDRMNSIDRKSGDSNAGTPQLDLLSCESKSSSVIITPSRSRACCIGREGSNNASSTYSP